MKLLLKKLITHVLRKVDIYALFTLSLLLFLTIMVHLSGNTDLPAHVKIAMNMNTMGNLFSGNFVLYLLINLFSFFTGKLTFMKIVLCVLLAIAITLRYHIVQRYLNCFMLEKKSQLLSFSLSVIYIVPLFYFLKVFGIFLNTNSMYFGYFVPNVWHNSTIIFLFPFAILLYLLSVKQYHEFDRKRNFLICLLVVLNVLIKPSFFFVFIVAYPFMIVLHKGFSQSVKYILLPLISGLISLLYVYSTIYNGNDGSEVIISFQNVLNFDFWITNIQYLVISLFLPILYFIVNYKVLVKDWEFLYVLLLFIVSVGIFYLSQETGPRANHGNFYWQIVISTWLIFLYLAKHIFITKPRDEKQLKLNFLFKTLFSIHVLMGLIYILKLLLTKDYA